MNPPQQPPNIPQAPGTPHNLQAIKISKREMREKISSRQDFVIVFGLERELISRVFFASQTLHYLAVYHQSTEWGKTSFETIPNSNQYRPPKNPGPYHQKDLGDAQGGSGTLALLPRSICRNRPSSMLLFFNHQLNPPPNFSKSSSQR